MCSAHHLKVNFGRRVAVGFACVQLSYAHHAISQLMAAQRQLRALKLPKRAAIAMQLLRTKHSMHLGLPGWTHCEVH